MIMGSSRFSGIPWMAMQETIVDGSEAEVVFGTDACQAMPSREGCPACLPVAKQSSVMQEHLCSPQTASPP